MFVCVCVLKKKSFESQRICLLDLYLPRVFLGDVSSLLHSSSVRAVEQRMPALGGEDAPGSKHGNTSMGELSLTVPERDVDTNIRKHVIVRGKFPNWRVEVSKATNAEK